MNKQLVFTIAKYLLAIHLIVFGANKFLLFANVAPPTDGIAQQFLGTMFTSYLAKLVGLIEIVGGILLLIPRTSFLGFLILLPVTANIVAFHLAHDLPGNGIWIFTLITTLIVAIPFQPKFMDLLIIK